MTLVNASYSLQTKHYTRSLGKYFVDTVSARLMKALRFDYLFTADKRQITYWLSLRMLHECSSAGIRNLWRPEL